jgi:Protein of unknown function (DUF3631)
MSVSVPAAKSASGDKKRPALVIDAPVVRILRDELLFCPGQRKTHLYLIEAGSVVLYQMRTGGTHEVIEFAFADTIGNQYPDMPDGVEDRNADVWEPLLAVADAAGRSWPAKARVSAVSFVSLSRKDGGGSLGVRLLTDLHTIFGDEDKLHTTTILERFHNLEEAPWSSIKGTPINDRFLAQLLKGYGVESNQVRVGSNSMKGYEKKDLHDA